MKVEVWKQTNGYKLRIKLNDPLYGDIFLYSDHYGGIREADSRAFVVARQLGLERDTLPVHTADEKPDVKVEICSGCDTYPCSCY